MTIRSKFRFWIGLNVVLFLLGLALTACGLDTTDKTGVANTSPVSLNEKLLKKPPTVLKVWLADDYYKQAPITDLIKDFQAAYPNITISLESSEWSKLRSKLKDAIGSGRPPDVAHQHAFVFGAQNFAEPLDDMWQQWDNGKAASRFMPGSLEDVTWDGTKYGVPLDINTVFLIYNKKMFKDAGLPEPDNNYNYTKLLSDARKLTKPDGSQFGLALKPGAWDTYGVLRSNGGELMDEQHQQQPVARLDSPQNLQILEYVSDLMFKEHVAVPPTTGKNPDPVELFKQNKIAMFFSGPWDLKELEQNAPSLYAQTGTAMLPKGIDGKSNGSVQGGGSLFVPRGSQNKEAAFEFMKWASSPQYQMRLTREMGRYPVLTELYNDPYFTSQALLKPYLEQLKTARPYKLEAYAQSDILWEQAVNSIFIGRDVKSALADANRAVQADINLARLVVLQR